MKFKNILIHKKLITLFLTAILIISLTALNIVVVNHEHITTSSTKTLKPIYSVDRDDNNISISFDCAWGGEKTMSILDTLDKYNVKCTFFMVSFWAEKYRELVKEIISRGHEIGTHSSTHPHFNSLSSDKKTFELTDSIQRIEKISNTKITLFRPPFGEYNTELISLSNSLGLDVIQWDVDTLDWKGISGKEIYERTVPNVKSGSIILCHNDADNVISAIDMIIPALISKGYKFVKISNLILEKPYTVDNNGVQRLIT